MSNASLWQFPASGSVDTADYYTSPVMSSDGSTIYYAAGSTLYAVSASSGAQSWAYSTADGATFEGSTPAVGPDGTIYVGATDGNLYAVSSLGALEWTYGAGGGSSFYGTGIESSPLVGPDGTIYFGSENGYLYALTPLATSGGSPTLAWDYLTAQPPSGYTCDVQVSCGIFTSSPALSPTSSTVYIGGEDGNLYAVSPPTTPGSTTGTLVWKVALGDVVNTPAVSPDGSTVYATQLSGSLYSVNAATGAINWRSFGSSSPAIGPDGTVYAAGSTCLYAVNPDGSLRWSSCVSGASFDSSSPAVDTNGIVYLGSGGSQPGMYAFRPADGTGAWYYNTGAYTDAESPAIGGDGTIYFNFQTSSSTGALYAMGGATVPRSTPTPTVNTTVQNTTSPDGLAVNPANGEVFASSCSSISVIDGSSNTGPTSNTVIDTIYPPPAVFPQKAACFYGMVFDPSNGELYAIDVNNYAVLAFDGTTFALDATIVVGGVSSNAQSMTFDSANGDIYVATGSSSVAVIDGSTNTAVATVPLPQYSASQTVAYDPSNNEIYVGSEGTGLNGIAIIDPSSNAVTSTILISGSYIIGATYDPANQAVYFTDIDFDEVFVVSSTNTLIDTIHLAVPDHDYEAWAIAYDSLNNYLYVAGYDTNSVPVIDGSTNTVVTTIAMTTTANQRAWPIAVVFDPMNGDIYVGNNPSDPGYAVEVIFTGTPPSPTSSTATALACTPSSVSAGSPTTCTATVTDTSTSPTTPTGSVSLSSSPSVSSLNLPASCALSASVTGAAICSVTFTPGTGSAGSYVITAKYSGDSAHSASSGTASLTVLATIPVNLPDTVGVSDATRPPAPPLADSLHVLDRATTSLFRQVTAQFSDLLRAADAMQAPPGPFSEVVGVADRLVAPLAANLGEFIHAIDTPSFSSSATIPSTTGRGQVTFHTSAGVIDVVPLAGPTPGVDSGQTPGYGFFSFTITGLSKGQTVTVTITFPHPLPPGAKWMKFQGTKMVTNNYPIMVSGNTLKMVLTDGVRPGDLDGAVNGQISDPGGLTVPVSAPQGPSPLMLAAFAVALLSVLAFALRSEWRRVPPSASAAAEMDPIETGTSAVDRA